MGLQIPNIVFIVLDTHRVDRLGCYGYPRPTSPNLDAFAEQATFFDNAISPAQWTIPSHASMFSGEFPSTHMTIQASSALSDDFTTLAEYLRQIGYQTAGFCNNPLVGVLENGFRRGFDQFFNYGGAITNTPPTNGYVPRKLLPNLRESYRQALEKISIPIQQAVAGSPGIFQIVLNPKLVSLWTRHANFKGDGPASINDTTRHLQNTYRKSDPPQFTFLNLMGTHLPYTPPEKFIQQLAPIVLEDPEADAFMRDYNTRAFHWLLPMKEPYSALEAKTLSDMYDAEVAYQDELLAQILSELDKPEHRQNTMVIIVSDHGEMLGEHNLMGHGIGLYQELIHVPLMIRFPGQKTGKRISDPVSTTYLFHTVLSEAGIEQIDPSYTDIIDTTQLSLKNAGQHEQTSSRRVFSEGYPSMNLIKIIEKHEPTIMRDFNCEANIWANFTKSHGYKLLRTDQIRDELFDLVNDPLEQNDLAEKTQLLKQLTAELDKHLDWATSRAPGNQQNLSSNYEEKHIQDRLRSLGYLD